ncbi:hypothetical protein LY76DRAFT_380117 [Colletotrichum caudatum]|nr:hypothetical protein LY76DRAFT_380117 [Colletotrichum caudatum]
MDGFAVWCHLNLTGYLSIHLSSSKASLHEDTRASQHLVPSNPIMLFSFRTRQPISKAPDSAMRAEEATVGIWLRPSRPSPPVRARPLRHFRPEPLALFGCTLGSADSAEKPKVAIQPVRRECKQTSNQMQACEPSPSKRVLVRYTRSLVSW